MSEGRPAVSLILTTYRRTEAVARFLDSLEDQGTSGLELIVIDQNEDRGLQSQLSRTCDLDINYIHLGGRVGVSMARNIGLRSVTGRIIGFPDDDCHYPPGAIDRVSRILRSSPFLGGVSGRVSTPSGEPYARFDQRPGYLTRSNTWQRVSAVSLFLTKRAVDIIGSYDESLGPGSGTPWGGAEDIDYPLRAVNLGLKILYDPRIEIIHPAPSRQGEKEYRSRAYRYGLGIGRVWRKHGFPIWTVAHYLVRPLAGAAMNLALLREERGAYHWSAFKGRWRGWTSPYP